MSYIYASKNNLFPTVFFFSVIPHIYFKIILKSMSSTFVHESFARLTSL